MLPQNDCGACIKHINDVLHRDSNNELRDQELTFAQLNVLLQLEDAAEQGMPLKELERRLHVAQSTAAGIIVRLEHKRFVESFSSKVDKRVKMVRITERGLACCTQAQDHMKQTEERLLSSLTEEERETFTRLLQKVSDSL